MTRSGGFGLLVATAAMAAALLVACGNDDEPQATPTPTAAATQTASPTNTPESTPTPSVEEEVEAAYLAYWDAYSEAVLNLDVSLVENHATGEELERLREEIEMLQADGVAVRVVVEHDLLVVMTSDTTATVVDEVVNNSFFVDPVTKDPPTAPGTGEILHNTFFLEKVDERWVVTRGTREQS